MYGMGVAVNVYEQVVQYLNSRLAITLQSQYEAGRAGSFDSHNNYACVAAEIRLNIKWLKKQIIWAKKGKWVVVRKKVQKR